MPSLQFKGKVFAENHHLAVPFHELQPVRSKGLSKKASLHDKHGRIYADFILTLRPDEPDPGDEYHQVFVVETKGIHIKQSADTDYKRSVFDICTEHASKKDWAKFVPAMRNKVMRFEIVDEDEWEQRLNAMLVA